MANADEMIGKIFDNFCKTYEVAESEGISNCRLSSHEIQDIVESIFDEGAVSKQTIFEQLTARGYKYILSEDGREFMWIFKQLGIRNTFSN